jgi:Tol biopolymer transport system component
MPGGDKILLGTFDRVLGAQGLEIPENSDEGYNLWTVELKKPPVWRPVIPKLNKFKADIRLKPHATKPITYRNLYDPVLSRDGRYLVFSWCGHYDDLAGYQLYITDMRTMETEMLTRLEAHTDAVEISPDNKKVLFTTSEKEPLRNIFHATNLWMINRDGTGLRNFILDFSAVAGNPPADREKQPFSTLKELFHD